MPDFIAYYRVSTDRQGASGLGLEAQRAAVLRHIATGQLAAEYTEVESGKKHTNRPQLLAALQECRRRKATLVIAKLDRLGRNVAFISALMEGGADFGCCDNPHANRLMLHMLAAFAEHEREQISERTKAAASRSGADTHRLAKPKIRQLPNTVIIIHLQELSIKCQKESRRRHRMQANPNPGALGVHGSFLRLHLKPHWCFQKLFKNMEPGKKFDALPCLKS